MELRKGKIVVAAEDPEVDRKLRDERPGALEGDVD